MMMVTMMVKVVTMMVKVVMMMAVLVMKMMMTMVTMMMTMMTQIVSEPSPEGNAHTIPEEVVLGSAVGWNSERGWFVA